jgi:hypothetical protein
MGAAWPDPEKRDHTVAFFFSGWHLGRVIFLANI